MKPIITHEELSAYLDGEAARPHHAAQAIRDVPEMQQKFVAYRHISERIASLPEPLVQPNFAGNVIRELEARQSSKRSWWSTVVTPLATAAAFLAILSVTAITVLDTNVAQPVPVASSTSDGAATENVGNPKLAALLKATYAERDQQDTSSYAVESSWLFDSNSPREFPGLTVAKLDNTITALAEVEYFDRLASPELESGSDIRAALNSMDDSQTQTFMVLLADYAHDDGSSL